MQRHPTLSLVNAAKPIIRSEPRLWVREFAIYQEFKPEGELRRITLRKGLNIIWAKESETGASGHAAGKSTFCRMLRYLIGDGSYGSEVFRTSFREKFPKSYLAGEVYLERVPWLVVRSFGRAGNDWCAKGHTWESLFSEDLKHQKYTDFTDALHASFILPLVSPNFPGTEKPMEWAHLLQWFTRDQDARYSNILEWRPSSDGAESKHLSAVEKTNLVRMVLHLLSDKEHKRQVAHSALLSKQASLESANPKLIFVRDRAIEKLKEQFPELADAKSDLATNLDAAVKRLQEEESALQKAFTKANGHDGVGQVLAANLKREEDRRAKLESTDENLTKRLNHARLHLKLEKKEISEKEFAKQSAKLGDIEGQCSRSLDWARLARCPIAPLANRDEIQAMRLEQARSVAENLQIQIDLEVAARKPVKLQLADAMKSEKLLATKIAKLQQDHIDLRQKLSTSLSDVRKTLEAVKGAVKVHEEIQENRKSLQTVKSDIVGSTKLLARLRKESGKRLTDLRDHFSDVASHMLKEIVNGTVAFHSDKIVPSLAYVGDESSAALVTLRLLIFDLACLVGSSSSFPFHPGFLLHDSPREADLSAAIYRRIFTLVAGEDDKPENELVQYIVATTEAPPSALQDKPWLACEPLSSANAKGRLLKTVI